MTKKNALYGFIDYSKQNSLSSEIMINEASQGFYRENIDEPYYVINLPKSKQNLELDDNLIFICTEQHTTFFAVHKSEYRQSDLHYTALFTKPNEPYTYKLHVFINAKDEPTDDINFYQQNVEHNSSTSIQFTAKQRDQVIQYALSQTSPLLKVLRKEHQAMLEKERIKYAEKNKAYQDIMFDSETGAKQLSCIRAVLSSLDVLLMIDNINRQKEHRRLSKILHCIENPSILTIPKPVATPSVDFTPNNIVESLMAIESGEAVSRSMHIERKKALVLLKWNELKELAASLQEAQKKESIPVSTIARKINPSYLNYIVLLENRYRAFVTAYLLFEEDNDNPIFMVAAPQESYILFEQIREQHDKLAIQCLNTIFTIPSRIDNMNDILQALSNHVSKLDPILFRFAIKNDRADFLSYLLAHFSFQTTMLPPDKQLSIHSGKTDKTLLEEIIIKGKINCLREVIKQGYRLNLLELASDGLPLASHVLRLDLFHPFRAFCLRNLKGFDSISFYLKLNGILKSQSNRVEDINNLSLHTHYSSTRLLAGQVMNMFSNLPESLTDAHTQFKVLANEFYPSKLIQIEQLNNEVSTKSDQLIKIYPQLKKQLSAAIRACPDNLIKNSADLAQKFINFIPGVTDRLLERLLNQTIKYLKELNKYLYYSLPSDPTDPDKPSLIARENLLSYHAKQVELQSILVEDPLNEYYKRLSPICDSLEDIKNETLSMAQDRLRIIDENLLKLSSDLTIFTQVAQENGDVITGIDHLQDTIKGLLSTNLVVQFDSDENNYERNIDDTSRMLAYS